MNKLVFVSIVIFLKDITSESLSIWLQERIEDGPLNGLWEFPGGKIEAGEMPAEACVREVFEEVGIKIKAESLDLFKLHPYISDDKSIILNVFKSDKSEYNKQLNNIGRWETLYYKDKSKSLEAQIPKVNHEFLDQLLGYYEQNGELTYARS